MITFPFLSCSCCSRSVERKGKRAPRGWDVRLLLCPACRTERFCLRAITFAVAGLEGDTWADLRAALRESWGHATELANWAASEFYARDQVQRNGQAKMPGMPYIYLYPDARSRFPDLPPVVLQAVINGVQQRYRAARYEVKWTGERSLSQFRYPFPLPIPAVNWSAAWLESPDPNQPGNKNRRPIVTCTFGGRKWTLRLRTRGQHKRLLGDFDAVVRGEAPKGELMILRQRSAGPLTERRAGQRAQYDVVVKIVARFPRRPRQERSGILRVRTDSESLIVALNEKDERLWVIHADHLRRWQAEHSQRLQRWADDSKAEQRPVPNFAARREIAVLKHRARVRTAIQQVAAQIVCYAMRRRFAAIRYDDTDKRYCERFPWEQLRSAIQWVCEREQLTFDYASGEVAQETTAAAHGEEIQDEV